jgi:hypothetical protein
MDCQDEPEIKFNKSLVLGRSGLPRGYAKSGGWTYEPESGLLRFDWDGVSRVWKYTGETARDDGVEFMVFRWPD